MRILNIANQFFCNHKKAPHSIVIKWYQIYIYTYINLKIAFASTEKLFFKFKDFGSIYCMEKNYFAGYVELR